jgi:hypothetical protein
MNNSNNQYTECDVIVPSSQAVFRSVAIHQDLTRLASSSGVGESGPMVHAKSCPSYEAMRTTGSDSVPNEYDCSSEADANEPLTTTWSRRTPALRPVGQYHLASKNCANVSKQELPAVLARLEAAFQAASCQCDYSEDRVKCHTLEETTFVVSFWLKKKDDASVLIEIDHVAGDSMVFHGRYVPLVMQAISGTTAIRSVTCGPFTRELSDQQMNAMHASLSRVADFEALAAFDDVASHLENAVDIVGDMLASDRYDVSGLGLQSLTVMTDPLKSFPEVAVAVARIVLTGSSTTGESLSHRNSKIQQYVSYLALTGRLWRTNMNTTIDESMDDPDMAEQHAYKALIVLANAMKLASTEDVVSFVRAAEQLPGVHSVVDCLLAMVRDAQTKPHSAYWSAEILAALAHHSVESDRMNVYTIQQARFVGTRSHAALAQATRLLLTELAAAS